MKLWPLILIPLCGCVMRGNITSETVSGVGLSVSYNQSTQLPELRLGYFRQTYHFVPTNSPPITSSLSLEQHGFTTAIFEEFTTGGAQIPSNSVARTRAMLVAPPEPPAVRKLTAPKDQRTGSNHAAVFGAEQARMTPYTEAGRVTISLQEYHSLKSAADSTLPPAPR